jgi:hypothetical protein
MQSYGQIRTSLDTLAVGTAAFLGSRTLHFHFFTFILIHTRLTGAYSSSYAGVSDGIFVVGCMHFGMGFLSHFQDFLLRTGFLSEFFGDVLMED